MTKSVSLDAMLRSPDAELRRMALELHTLQGSWLEWMRVQRLCEERVAAIEWPPAWVGWEEKKADARLD